MGAWSGNPIGRVFGTAAAVAILAEATPWRILVTQWARTPAATVTPTDTVSFRAVTLPRPEATNLTLTTWYRASPATHFTALAITNQAAVFTTASSIPAMPAGTTCEYHLVATYWRDGLVYTHRYPSACEEDDEAFIVSP